MESENPALAKSPTLVVRKMKIPAGGSGEMVRDADFISCLEANADFRISFDSGPPAEFMAGLTYRTREGFKRLEFINPTAAEINIKYALGRGDIRDARLIIGSEISTRGSVPDVFTSGAPISALNAATTALAGANAKRRELLLTNSGAGTVYIGGNPVALAGQGLPLAAGAFMTLDNTAAVYARNDTGAAVAVAVAQSEWAV